MVMNMETEREIEWFSEERDLVYEDDDFLVINKAAGLYTHRNHKGHRVTAAADLLRYKVNFPSDELRGGCVHRLDHVTSGLLIIAKREEVRAAFTSLFKRRAIHKYYTMLTHGLLYEGEGEIITALARHPRNRMKRIVVADGEGKVARTRYCALRFYQQQQLTLVEAELLTGRTHQLRVHFAHKGHAIVGDPLYGNNRSQKNRAAGFFLFARKLFFHHPMTGQPLSLELPLPAFFNEKLMSLAAAVTQNA